MNEFAMIDPVTSVRPRVLRQAPTPDMPGLVMRPLADRADTAAVASIPAKAQAVDLAAENNQRKGLVIFNDSSAPLRIKYGAGAGREDFTDKVAPDSRWVMPSPIFPGVVSGMWEKADGAARVTELTSSRPAEKPLKPAPAKQPPAPSPQPAK